MFCSYLLYSIRNIVLIELSRNTVKAASSLSISAPLLATGLLHVKTGNAFLNRWREKDTFLQSSRRVEVEGCPEQREPEEQDG